jgi:hypothetical protein
LVEGEVADAAGKGWCVFFSELRKGVVVGEWMLGGVGPEEEVGGGTLKGIA